MYTKEKTAHFKDSYLLKDVIICLNQLMFLKLNLNLVKKIQLKKISFKMKLNFLKKVILSPSFDIPTLE